MRDELQFYATSARTDIAKELGFIGGKLPLLHGPAEGDEGLKKNIKIIEDMRNKVGDDFWLMYDCWMSLDLKARVRRARESGDPVEPTLSTGSCLLDGETYATGALGIEIRRGSFRCGRHPRPWHILADEVAPW
ncbi:hypothetical protein [Bradyrhizobium sp. Ec3.3]|uniref:hypothetical protein n=1 Tax=Bradyrhizobium sp. Ec3.3 TaxID=189753 RepID=UPI000404929F|nr:hypothetical protein [Bradyrhizobium sp. Ec3.3]